MEYHLQGPVVRGLSGVATVTSDAHAGLVDTIGAALPGASWQRCRPLHREPDVDLSHPCLGRSKGDAAQFSA
ncbi:transposase [Nocardioides sp. NPDC051685]|uniref:transposase n=1 Tax=Nocardioides sp. NPDC051685 TaxID=3364334 RepID=UPI0037931A32